MLMEVKNHLKVMVLSFKYNVMRYMVNKMSFITNVIFMMLNNSTFIIQWLVLFNLRSEIGNYGFKEVVILWALAASTFGFSHMFFFKAYSLSDLISKGKLDSFLVQPKNTLISVLTSDTSVSAIGDLLYGFVMLIIFDFSIYKLLLFTLFTVTGGLMLSAIAVMWGSLSFWIVKADTLAYSMNGMMTNFATYPEGIFKGITKILLYTIIPVGISNFIPMSILTSFNLLKLSIVIAITILLILFAFLIFNKGLKRYSSSSLMSARI